MSSPVHVASGVLQGNVLGPLMLLVSADDCLLYRQENSERDAMIGQTAGRWNLTLPNAMYCEYHEKPASQFTTIITSMDHSRRP